MVAFAAQLQFALGALQRNRLQTALALLGVVVGVGALVTSVALARGAQASLQDQLLAAGANMIVVTSGNYRAGRPVPGGVEADHGSLLDPRDLSRPVARAPRASRVRPGGPGAVDAFYASLRVGRPPLSAGAWRSVPAHFEDDPMAVHDHPTAAERLGDSMAGLGAAATLSVDDARAIRRELGGIQFVASGVHENARLSRADGSEREWFTRLHGTEADLPLIRRSWVFPSGRFLDEREVSEGARVMVLGRVVADRLFEDGTDPVGGTVLLWNQEFEVVGVVGSRSWAAMPVPGDDQFDAVYVPVTTVHELLNLSKLNTISVTTRSAGDTSRIAKEITELLRERHGITDEMPDDFLVRTQAQEVLGEGLAPEVAQAVSGNLQGVDQITIEQLASSLERSNRTLLSLLGGIAAVSLLVGGIGVMNLLFLSVTQRTREIGLRMAMGARKRDIAGQFLAEALVLCLVGGVAGAGLGLLAAYGLEGVLAWSTVVSPLSAVLAVVVAALLGMAAGALPARRAAALDPIRALHRE